MNKQLKELAKESLKYKSPNDFIQSMRLPAMLKSNYEAMKALKSYQRELKKLPKNNFADKGIGILEKNAEQIPKKEYNYSLRGWFDLARDLYDFARKEKMI